ncbi:MAG TPA: helix-turn-helix transcriptional regulator [Acidimicrobiales bacterium]|nr:helix-turn-helix transcriptional regulator [Acidimicrobiales bacterium]
MKDSELVTQHDERSTAQPLTVGRALELRRDELGLSREGAASAIGVSRSTYSAYASDQRRLSPDSLRMLIDFLDIDIEELLGLYGATCVLQARRALLRGTPPGSEGVERAGLRRTVSGNDMTIVERVYFDVKPRHDSSEVIRELAPVARTEFGQTTVDGAEGTTRHEKDKKNKKNKKGRKEKKKNKKANGEIGRDATTSQSDARAKRTKKSKSKKHKSKSKKGG